MTTLSDEDEATRRRLARDLGINRSELLAGINGILIVEGPQDEVILE